MTMSDTITRPKQGDYVQTNTVTEFAHEPGDHEKFSHYLKKEYHDAYVTGEMVEALCGHRWVPTKDPKRFPVCPECKEIFESLPPGDDA